MSTVNVQSTNIFNNLPLRICAALVMREAISSPLEQPVSSSHYSGLHEIFEPLVPCLDYGNGCSVDERGV